MLEIFIEFRCFIAVKAFLRIYSRRFFFILVAGKEISFFFVDYGKTGSDKDYFNWYPYLKYFFGKQI